MKLRVLVSLVITCLALTGIPAFGQTPPYLNAKLSLVLVETSAGTGSGFAVAPNVVATACHVVKGAAAIRVYFWAAKVQSSARAAMCNEKYDIAFIAVRVPEGTVLLPFAAAGTTAARLLSELPPTAAEEAEAQPVGNSGSPGEGIGAVRLGMTPARVQEVIGLPPSRRTARGWYDWDTRRLSVLFDSGKAVIIYTEDPTAVTAEGIRLGSTDVDLIKAYGGPACSSLFPASGRATLAWGYHGLLVFISGSPRQIGALAVVPGGFASVVCR